MATQIKITKNYFSIDKHGNRTTERRYISYLDFESSKAVFDIEETDNVSVIFEFSSEDCMIEIESADSGEMRTVVSGKEFDLQVWDEDNAYFPGYFDISVTYRGERKRFYFCVHPKTLEIENVMYLRRYVNAYYDGISLDLEKKRKMKVVYDDNNTSFSDFSSYNFMMMYYSDCINYMNRYVKRRYEKLDKKNQVSTKISKISAKSVKWLVQKGQTKNADIKKPVAMLTSKVGFSLDNEQNRIFKAFVCFWDVELNNLLHNLSEYRARALHSIDALKAKLDELVEDKQAIDSLKKIPAKYKKQLAGKIKDHEASIQLLENTLNEYQTRYDNINHFKIFTENVRHNTWVSTMKQEENYAYKRVTNKELVLIKELRDRYLGVRKRITYDNAQQIDYFAEKSTPKLFETYLYVLLINIMKSHGFEMNEGIFGSTDLMLALSTQSKIVLSNKKGYRCEIIYDKALEDAQDEFIESDFCTINSSHNKPDFIVAIKNPSGQLIDAVVIEAKWRKLSNIYSEFGDTEVLTSLKDYSNLCYFDSDLGKVQRGIISKVIALYPDYEENQTNLYSDLITYCGLNICKEIESTKNYAYLSHILKAMIDHGNK